LAAQEPAPAPPPSGPIAIDRVVAVVGTEPILLSEIEGIAQQTKAQQRQPYPTDSAERMKLLRETLDEYIDVRVVVAAAKAAKVAVDEAQLAQSVDAQIAQIRKQFPNDSVFQQILRREGFASIQSFRTLQLDRMRDSAIAGTYRSQLQQEGKFPHAPVTDAEIKEFFEMNRAQFGTNLGGVTFRQIVVPLQSSAAAKLAARTRIDSLRAAIMAGADFEEIAKRESADSTSRVNGGDLGWWRRGGGLLPEFERWIFALPQGAVSPVFETYYGFHIARVDRVAPGEVKSRHILIRPATDSADLETTKALADSIAGVLRARPSSYDSLAAKYHKLDELKSIPTPIPLDSLASEYRTAMTGLKAGEVSAPFMAPDAQGQPTMRVVAVTGVVAPREFTLDDWRTMIRDDLTFRKGMRKLIERLRKEVHVSVQL
jgi:peptidyl-prolyl cis-trans isomerase SurA